MSPWLHAICCWSHSVLQVQLWGSIRWACSEMVWLCQSLCCMRRAGTTVLHAAVSTPYVICLHLLSDMTRRTELNPVTRQSVTHPIVSPIFVPNVVTTSQLAVDPIYVPICVLNWVPNFVIIRHLDLDPLFVPNSVPTFVPHFRDNPSSRSEPSTRFLWTFVISFWTHFSSQLSVQSLCPPSCSLRCLSSTDNSDVDNPPNIELLPPGVFLNMLRRCQMSCHVFPCRVSPHVCAPVAWPPVCVSPVASVTPTRVRPLCVILTGLCVLSVVVLLHIVKAFLPFLAEPLSFVFVLAFALARLALALAFVLFAFAFVVCARPFCKYTVFFRYPLAMCQSIPHLEQLPWNFWSWMPIADKSIGTGSVFFVLIQRFRSLHKLRPFCRTSGVDQQTISKSAFLQTFDYNFNLISSDRISFTSCSKDVTRLSDSVKESMMSPLKVVASKSTSSETVLTVEIGSYRRKRRRYASKPSGFAALSTNRCARPLVNMISTWYNSMEMVRTCPVSNLIVVSA